MSAKLLRGLPVGVIPRGGLRVSGGGVDVLDIIKATQAASLIGYWPLNEPSGSTATDQSGAGHNGSYSGVTLGQTGIGDGRTCPSFSGSSQYVNLYSTALRDAFSAAEGTISLFFKASDAAVWSDSATRVIIEIRVNGSNYVHIYKSGTNHLIAEYVAGGTASQMGTANATADMSQLLPADANWRHLAITWNKAADRVRMYLDGSQVGYELTGLGTWSGVPASDSMVIGGLSTALFFWKGNIAHVGLWTKELTAAELYSIAWNYKKSASLYFGDSITNGVGASDDAHKWIRIVRNALGQRYGSNQGITATILQNTTQNSIAVIGGAAAQNGRDTYTTRVTPYRTSDKVYILYGLNDLRLDDAAITQANFVNDLGEVIDGIIASDIPASRIVLGSPPHITKLGASDTSPWTGATVLKLQQYTAAIAAMAATKGTKYADVYNYMLNNGGDTLVSADGIHPNDAGHAAIAACFLAAT